jgi:3-oxoacyl-[acyl-carrier protein] reductase
MPERSSGNASGSHPLSRSRANVRSKPLALPHLARSSAGRIVLISSGVSRRGIAGATAYSTAKGALDGLLASLKWEAGAMGFLVNIVSPGFTVTEGQPRSIQRRRA